jgi:hypothetical protein
MQEVFVGIIVGVFGTVATAIIIMVVYNWHDKIEDISFRLRVCEDKVGKMHERLEEIK